jgi:hypothetical protein
VLTFAPGRTYDAGLVAGGLLVLALVGLAAVPARRRGRRGRQALAGRSVRPLVWATALVAGGLLAGWVGLGAMLVAVLACSWGRVRPGAEVLAGLLVFAAGAWTAWDRADADTLTNRAGTQWLLVVALAFALLALDDGGRVSLRRRKGRSTT